MEHDCWVVTVRPAAELVLGMYCCYTAGGTGNKEG
uniref:Uncharacterized protein n=1 Tax=Anguilla anguilla TaxID=7936 RepID=A0A0E9U9G8_ANGAN